MNGVSLADKLEDLLNASADDIETRQSLDIIRVLYNSLVSLDRTKISEIYKVAVATPA
jgi:hypothetical protein